MLVSTSACAAHLRRLMPHDAEAHLANLRAGILPALTQADLDEARHLWHTAPGLDPEYAKAVERSYCWLADELMSRLNYCRVHPEETLASSGLKYLRREARDLRSAPDSLAASCHLDDGEVTRLVESAVDLAPGQSAEKRLAFIAQFALEQARRSPFVPETKSRTNTFQRGLQRSCARMLLRRTIAQQAELHEVAAAFGLPAATVSVAIDAYAYHRSFEQAEVAAKKAAACMAKASAVLFYKTSSNSHNRRLDALFSWCEQALEGGDLRQTLIAAYAIHRRKQVRISVNPTAVGIGGAVAAMVYANNAPVLTPHIPSETTATSTAVSDRAPILQPIDKAEPVNSLAADSLYFRQLVKRGSAATRNNLSSGLHH